MNETVMGQSVEQTDTPPISDSVLSASAAAEPSRNRGLRLPSLAKYSGIFVLVGFIALFSIWVPDTFLTDVTLQTILSNQAITAIVAFGLLFPLAAGVFDLSIGTMLGLTAVVTAKLTAEQGVGPVEALLIALGLGLLVGAVNGFLVVKIGLNSFIATLAVSSVLTAAILAFTNSNFIDGVPTNYQSIVSHQPLGLPLVAVYAVVLAVVCWYALEHTATGRRLASTGFGAEATRLAGVKTAKLTFVSLIISAVCASFAGALLTAKLGTATPSLGPPYLLPAFAVVFLGSTQVKPGRFNVGGTVVAILLLATGVKGLQLAGAPPWVTDLFYGVVLLVAVSLARLETRVSVGKRAKSRAAA
jgi:ribose transport system permease protein